MALRYFRTLLYSKSYRVAIPLGVARNHFALLFHLELLEITSRCYFTGTTQNHIALLFHWDYPNHTALLFSTNQGAYCWFLVSEQYNAVIEKTSPGQFQARFSRNWSRILKNIREKSFLEFRLVHISFFKFLTALSFFVSASFMLN